MIKDTVSTELNRTEPHHSYSEFFPFGISTRSTAPLTSAKPSGCTWLPTDELKLNTESSMMAPRNRRDERICSIGLRKSWMNTSTPESPALPQLCARGDQTGCRQRYFFIQQCRVACGDME